MSRVLLATMDLIVCCSVPVITAPDVIMSLVDVFAPPDGWVLDVDTRVHQAPGDLDVTRYDRQTVYYSSHSYLAGELITKKVKKVKADIALPGGNPISELRDVTCHMGSHSVTCHPTEVNTPRLTPAMKTGTRFTYPVGMEG